MEQRVEELKRQLEMLRKLNDEAPEMAQNLERMEKSQTLSDMQKSMEQAQQGMQQGEQDRASKYAFQARDEASRLAEMAQGMQQQMEQMQEEDTVEQMERIVQGLIDVSHAEEGTQYLEPTSATFTGTVSTTNPGLIDRVLN